MAGKKITELTHANAVTDNDLFIVETANGTCSVPYSKIKRLFQNMLEVNAGETQSFPFVDCAASHNGIFRGKDLTNVYTIDEICERISNGTFEDLYIGDYFDITISTEYTANEVVRCILAGFDTYLKYGDTSFNKHHAVIVPKNSFTSIEKMNSTSTTGVSENANNPSDKGSYLGSDMQQLVLPVYAAAISSAIGSTHLLSRRSLLPYIMTPELASMGGGFLIGASSRSEWVSVQLQLLSEIQVYGANVVSSSFHDTGCDNFQLPLFALDPTLKICKNGGADSFTSSNRMGYWLRNVSSDTSFATINGSGNSGYSNASNRNAVRPFFCIG